MHGSRKEDRDVAMAMLDQALRDEECKELPTKADRTDWFYGSASFAEPDKHGWTAPEPSRDVWVPRSLVFWRMAVLTAATVSDEQICDRRYSLARWPAIEAMVGSMLAAATQPKTLEIAPAALHDRR